jgi:hypothetical protein
MTAQRAENEGFRVLEDFVCDAIHEPGIPQADPTKQGANEGIRVIKELVFEGERTSQQEGKESGQMGSSEGPLPRFRYFKETLGDPSVRIVDWERLRAMCNEGARPGDILEHLCLDVRDRELAFLEMRYHRVWRAVRSQALTVAQTQNLVESVRTALRGLVQDVEDLQTSSDVVAHLPSPEIIIQQLAREQVMAQVVEFLDALLVDTDV